MGRAAGTGAGLGTETVTAIADFAPYPTYPFYLDDLWYYNITSGIWKSVSKRVCRPPRLSRLLPSFGICPFSQGVGG